MRSSCHRQGKAHRHVDLDSAGVKLHCRSCDIRKQWRRQRRQKTAAPQRSGVATQQHRQPPAQPAEPQLSHSRTACSLALLLHPWQLALPVQNAAARPTAEVCTAMAVPVAHGPPSIETYWKRDWLVCTRGMKGSENTPQAPGWVTCAQRRAAAGRQSPAAPPRPPTTGCWAAPAAAACSIAHLVSAKLAPLQ